ncbi:hypothetical protein GCM10011415_32540 [Salipiger pallidus]|uniref:Uncharacterized protein n=1 Tax=Salipiger pallidus TaxID=1775170 RepID=A0A8J2ZMK0_9RHOB|nr:hypothetical protein [Salipiger pallidus]GGG80630.1 hypothetical protein GCM10011415_32540 [Salipiger pallidus]
MRVTPHRVDLSIFVTDGKGWSQADGEEKEEITLGDVICSPA